MLQRIALSTSESQAMLEGLAAWNMTYTGKPLPPLTAYQMFIVSNVYKELSKRLAMAYAEGRDTVKLKLHTVQINALVSAIRETDCSITLANALMKLEPKSRTMVTVQLNP